MIQKKHITEMETKQEYMKHCYDVKESILIKRFKETSEKNFREKYTNIVYIFVSKMYLKYLH